MGRIARVWNAMTDQQKLDELRTPTVTRARAARATKGTRVIDQEFVDIPLPRSFIDVFARFLVQVRRKAMGLTTLEQRAALVDRYWSRLEKGLRQDGTPAPVIAALRRSIFVETISWPWFGERTTYPPGEGE